MANIEKYLDATHKVIHRYCPIPNDKASTWLHLPRGANGGNQKVWTRMTLHWQRAQASVTKGILKSTSEKGTSRHYPGAGGVQNTQYWEEIFCFLLQRNTALPWFMTACFKTKLFYVLEKWLDEGGSSKVRIATQII